MSHPPSSTPDLSSREQAEIVFQGTLARTAYGKKLANVVLTTLNPSKREAAIGGLYYRAVYWMESLSALNHHKHIQAACSGARSLFELLLDTKELAADPTLIRRYHAFVFVERYRAARSLVKVIKKLGDDPSTSCEYELAFVTNRKNQKRYHRYRVRYWGRTKKGKVISPDSWRGRNAADRAQSLGSHYERLYRTVYPRLSWYVHAGATGFGGMSADGLTAAFALAHRDAQSFFDEITEEVAAQFGVFNASSDLRTEYQEVKRVIERVAIKKKQDGINFATQLP